MSETKRSSLKLSDLENAFCITPEIHENEQTGEEEGLRLNNRETLANIIAETVGMSDIVKAWDIAELLLGFFGYQNRITDNTLEPRERNIFYMLQDYGILKGVSEETTLYDRRDWRIHYWTFSQKLKDLVNLDNEEIGVDEEVVNMYTDLEVNHTSWGGNPRDPDDDYLP